MPAWAETFSNWAPDVNYVSYTGTETARDIIRQYELLQDNNPRRPKFHTLLTTYEYILRDSSFLSSIKWQYLAVDEAHRLKNPDSELYRQLRDFGVPSRLLITGTPMQNDLAELAALMDFLEPGSVNVSKNIDLEADDAKEQLNLLVGQIQPLMLRRTKTGVMDDLPRKTEKIIRVELSDSQLGLYRDILTRNYTNLNKGGNNKVSLLNIMMELKKVSNHPFLFGDLENQARDHCDTKDAYFKSLITSSGKMMLLDRLLSKLHKDNHRVLIFSQMVSMLDILADYLQMKGHQYQRIDGTISSSQRRHAIAHFQELESKDFCFLLSTRAGGLGINLMAADTVILFDSDWNPQADLQAMARAHRIGQKNPVSVYRFVSKDTVEEEILERARNKLMLEFITIQRGVTDNDARALSSKIAQHVAAPESADDINRILKRRGQKMFEQSGNQQKLEDLDIDAVLENAEEHNTEQPEGITNDGGEEFLKSFEFTDVKVDELDWDDIIPEGDLEAIKAAEKKREEEEALERIKEQNAPRQRKKPGAANTAEDREQRAAKQRARRAAAEHAAEAEDAESDSGSDPKRPLSDREVRNLVQAYCRHGSLEDYRDRVLEDAKLNTNRDFEVIKSTMDEIIRISKEKLDESRVKDGPQEMNKKDKKAVLFQYKGNKRVNAETMLDRPGEMRMLRRVVEETSDWRNFRVPSATKPAKYTSSWGAREDGMLAVGVARHGYGAWVAIRDDPDLGLEDKFFLEENKKEQKSKREQEDQKETRTPGAVHLVRRINYLLDLLKDEVSQGQDAAARRARENHHRNNKKWSNLQRRSEKPASSRASPSMNNVVKHAREPERSRHRGQSHSEHRHSEHRQLEHRQSEHRHSEHRQSERPEHRHNEHRRSEHRHSDHRHGEHRHPHNEHRQSIDRNGTPNLKRKASAEDEKSHKRRKSHEQSQNRDAPAQPARHTEAVDNKPVVGDKTISLLFGPVQDQLEKLRKWNAKSYSDPKEATNELKRLLSTIYKHINAKSRDGGTSLESRCWDHAVFYWPNKKKVTTGADLKKICQKLLASHMPGATKGSPNKNEADKDSSAPGSAPQTTNGVQKNGVVKSGDSNGTPA